MGSVAGGAGCISGAIYAVSDDGRAISLFNANLTELANEC